MGRGRRQTLQAEFAACFGEMFRPKDHVLRTRSGAHGNSPKVINNFNLLVG